MSGQSLHLTAGYVTAPGSVPQRRPDLTSPSFNWFRHWYDPSRPPYPKMPPRKSSKINQSDTLNISPMPLASSLHFCLAILCRMEAFSLKRPGGGGGRGGGEGGGARKGARADRIYYSVIDWQHFCCQSGCWGHCHWLSGKVGGAISQWPVGSTRVSFQKHKS